jgi:hypothetical protein|tara:strand:- start:41 stop:376 length:336 start_codon:yes stop_codon:yes gene_type:complete
MRIDEFASPVDNSLPFDVVDDVTVFMRNDPMFYRKKLFPAISKIADMHRAGKPIDQNKCLGPAVESALSAYCKAYDIASMPDEVFNDDDRQRIIDKLFSEEMEEIKKGEYK